jgi:hypothetical protein
MSASLSSEQNNRQIGQPVVYQMIVTLSGVKPPVWRRFLVRSDMTFYELHLALQVVMGWKNYHLYQFNVADVELSDPVTAAEFGAKNAEMVQLGRFLHGNVVSFLYEYDFCDNWRHEVVVEKRLPLASNDHFLVCLAGERACPPENSGGVEGYATLLQAIADPSHPERAELLASIAGRFDPELFDAGKANLALQALQ